LDANKCEVFSSGLKGAEAFFGEMAEKLGVKETVFTFSGHQISRDKAANVVVLSEEELKRGDISMEIISKMMNRTYYGAQKIRKVLQTLFHVVNNGHQVFVIGAILADGTVKGGTGWAAELAKLFNRPLSVFDQEKEAWFSWKEGSWHASSPKIEFDTFVGSGTRNLTDAGRKAVENLMTEAFGAK
jgi:hypothetical protein